MPPPEKFNCKNPQEEAAMALSKRLCEEGWTLCDENKYQEALPLFQQDLVVCEETCGADHVYVANSLVDIADCYLGLGDYGQALLLGQRALEIYEKSVGAEHKLTIRCVSHIWICYVKVGRSDLAIPLVQRELAFNENTCGAQSEIVAWNLTHLAYLQSDLNKYEEALALHQRALAIRKQCLGDDHEHTQDTRDSIKQLREKQEQANEAILDELDHRLQDAALNGNLQQATAALLAGARVDAPDRYFRTALMEASNHGHPSVVELLISKGADVLWVDALGRTPLSSAVEYGHLELVKYLLQHGADIATKDGSGRTLLMLSCISHPPICKFLLEQNVDCHSRDNAGLTALMVAALWGNAQCLELLLSAGAKVDAVDAEGRNALMLAARGKASMFTDGDYLAVVQRLLEHKANTRLRDKYGKTALDYAIEGDAIEGTTVVRQDVMECLQREY